MEPVPQKILLVDDDPDIIEVLNFSVQELDVPSGIISISTCADGAIAIEKLNSEKFDLVVIDISLPKMRGDVIVNEIRAGSSQNSRTPFIVISGHMWSEQISTQEPDVVDVYFVAKPFDPFRVSRLVKLWLTKSMAAQKKAS